MHGTVPSLMEIEGRWPWRVVLLDLVHPLGLGTHLHVVHLGGKTGSQLRLKLPHSHSQDCRICLERGSAGRQT